MAIGIIGAMTVEIEGILAAMTNVSTTSTAGTTFHQGQLAGKNVVLARCGIGKVFAAHAASIVTSHFPVANVINVGVAGGIAPELSIGDVVVSAALVQHDVEATAFGYALGQVPGSGNAFWQCCQNLICIAQEAAAKTLPSDKKLYTGNIATGDQFIHAPQVKNDIWNNFKPLCVEMEGAAIAQICQTAGIPFVAIRAISDKADGTAHEDFPAFVEETAEISAALVIDMIENL